MKEKTLIIIPGWGGSTETWQKFVDQARSFFTQVVCLDLPCFGHTPCPSEVWGVEEYADFVAKEVVKIQQQSDNQIVLLGHSFGGQVATQLIADKPEICDILILSGAAVYRRNRGVREIIFSAVAKSGKIILSLPILHHLQSRAKKLLYRVADSPDYNDTKGTKRSIFQKVIRQDVSHLLNKISKPTLVMWGESDSYVPLHLGQKIAQTIPHSSLVVIPKAGHGIHQSHSAEMLTLIQDFIGKQS